MLSIRGLSKFFRIDGTAIAALDNVSFEVEQGELFVLVGGSGSGKTTLLRCIAGLEMPDHGEVRIGGEVMSSDSPPVFIPPQRRRLGMVFQSYAVWPHLSVFENVALPLREGAQRIDPREVERRARQALELVELEELERRPATLLSGGQQQRVALARAIAVNSRMLLMDEPLSNLDARLRQDVRERIRDVAKQLGSTVVYVTHDQVEAMAIADRVGLLRKGKLVQVGSPVDLYRRPCEPAVADFLGQVNWFEGTLLQSPPAVETSLGVIEVSTCDRVTAGQRVLLGIRPECVVPVAGGIEAGPNILDAQLESTAFLGEQVVAHLLVGQQQLISKTRIAPRTNDGCVRVSIDPEDVMVFPLLGR
jgi:iron(III) transport system ATP-binding protein